MFAMFCAGHVCNVLCSTTSLFEKSKERNQCVITFETYGLQQHNIYFKKLKHKNVGVSSLVFSFLAFTKESKKNNIL